jgi:RNA polymerase sigma factor (sigma-70 family)
MVYGPLQDVLQHIRRMAFAGDAVRLEDAHLLERFIAARDETAFETLVRRHGPMVLGVCQRVLNDPEDIEDAFQVTFLVLIRKATSLSKRESLSSWLYGVAYRTALKARTLAARRRVHEKQIMKAAEMTPADSLVWRDLRPVLDQELQRLPAKYRQPVILCYLKGKTFEEAGQELGWPAGTVSGRLARAREMLRTRLTRRGVTLSAGLAATVFSGSALSAVVPAPLVTSTLRAAVLLTAGKTAAVGTLAVPVATLMEGVLHSMFLSKVKVVTLALLAFTTLCAGVGVVRYQTLVAQSSSPKQVQGPEAQVAEPQPPKADQEESLPAADTKQLKKSLDEATNLSEKLKALLAQRQEAARNELEARWQDFLAGRGMLVILLEVSGHLKNAELEMSPKRADQLAALEAHWKRTQKIEETNKRRFDEGRISLQEYEQSRYHRLNAEVQLERAKLGKLPKLEN